MERVRLHSHRVFSLWQVGMAGEASSVWHPMAPLFFTCGELSSRSFQRLSQTADLMTALVNSRWTLEFSMSYVDGTCKLLVTSASLLVTSALLVVTMFAIGNKKL